MWLEAEAVAFQRFLDDAEVYWRGQVGRPDGGSVVFVEALHHDVRVLLRNLTIAGALRRLSPARLVVLTGSDPRWRRATGTDFDVALVERMAHAYGVGDVVDVHVLADRRLAGVPVEPRPPARRPVPPIHPASLDRCVQATFCRLERAPRVGPHARASAAFAACRDRAGALTAIFDELFSVANPVALITSEVDYDQCGLAVQAAQRAAVPVIHTQPTGSLKAYALFPEHSRGGETPRAELTPQLGAFFADHVWPCRDRHRRSAERVAWRARANLGSPAGWRGARAAPIELTNAVERRQVRAHAAARLGFDPARPTVVVFNHAVCDAPGANREAFTDPAEWFEQTAAYAHSERAVNWLLLDHPRQSRSDASGFFGSVAARYAGAGNMAFRASRQVSGNVLWSLADLGLTVRDRIGSELPAYGIPVLQAGWSEWSACGLCLVAEDPATYWRTLDATLARLMEGHAVITADQVARARLWQWLHRSGADVVTGLVPAWGLWPAGHLLRAVRSHMRQVEPDGEPAFAAVERMWRCREPLLTRAALPVARAAPAQTRGAVAEAQAVLAGD